MMKIPKDVQKRTYELTYLIAASFTEAEKAKFTDEIKALVKRHKGDVTTVEDWGKKKMAYKIKHASKFHTDAIYTHVVFQANPENVQAFERDVYLNTQIMRHLLIVTDDQADEAAPGKAAK